MRDTRGSDGDAPQMGEPEVRRMEAGVALRHVGLGKGCNGGSPPPPPPSPLTSLRELHPEKALVLHPVAAHED